MFFPSITIFVACNFYFNSYNFRIELAKIKYPIFSKQNPNFKLLVQESYQNSHIYLYHISQTVTDLFGAHHTAQLIKSSSSL